jgi:hypothetical protein
MSTQEKSRLESPTAGPGASSDAPEPDEAAKKKAADMMTAYVDRPTVVLPGSGGAISGTAVNDWLDEKGDCKYGNDGPADGAKAAEDGATEDGAPEYMSDDQIAKDKEFNKVALKLAKDEAAARHEDAAKD